MARGHRLNTSIVLAAVHGLSGLFRAVSAVEPSLCRPLPTLSLSLIGHLASVDVKHQESIINQYPTLKEPGVKVEQQPVPGGIRSSGTATSAWWYKIKRNSNQCLTLEVPGKDGTATSAWWYKIKWNSNQCLVV